MCQHCCRMEWTPCAPIPYACPHCPVLQVSNRCHGPSMPFYGMPFLPPPKGGRPINKHTDLCKDISELYTYVVAAKQNIKRRLHRRRVGQARRLNVLAGGTSCQQHHRVEIPEIPLFRDPIHGVDTWTWITRHPVPPPAAASALSAPPTRPAVAVARPARKRPPLSQPSKAS